MPPKSLEERQAEMRQRLRHEKSPKTAAHFDLPECLCFVTDRLQQERDAGTPVTEINQEKKLQFRQ